MSTVKGTLTKIHKNGRFYSMLIDDVWYGTGASRPQAEEGNMIEFEASKNGKYWNADVDSVVVLGEGSPKPKKSPVSSSRTESFSGKDDYWKRKEERDAHNDMQREIGAGRNTAIAFVELLIKTEALKLPAAPNKKADALFEAVEYYREKFSSAHNRKVNDAAEETESAPDSDEDDYDE